MLLGFTFGTTKSLRKAFYNAQKGETVELEQEKISVSVDRPIRQIRFSADESQLLIATERGSIMNYSVSDINTNVRQYKHSIKILFFYLLYVPLEKCCSSYSYIQLESRNC